MENKNVVIYLRSVSSNENQVDPFFHQRMEIMQYCNDNDYNIVEEFSDCVEKVKSPYEGLMDLLLYLKNNKGKISCVVMRDSLRLSREHKVRKIYYLWLKSMGVSVIFIRRVVEDFLDSRKCTV